MTKDEALHKALKVLNCLNNDRVYETAWVKGAINACEEALEQPQPRLFLDLSNSNGNHPVEQPAWQGLTDDEIDEIYANTEPESKMDTYYMVLSRAIEQALKEKNTVTER